MTYFEDVFERIKLVTRAHTQAQIAKILDIRQSSISEAKKRNAIPGDWLIALFEKKGVNPDWLKTGTGPVLLRTDQGYVPTYFEELAAVSDNGETSLEKGVVTNIYSTYCVQGTIPDCLQVTGKIVLPGTYAAEHMLVFQIETEALHPIIRKGAYVGIDTALVNPAGGEIFAMVLPPEGIVLKMLALDSRRGCFVLHSQQGDLTENVLYPEEYAERIVGRLAWVLQNF